MNEKVVILDGGFATELEAGGFKIQGDPLWSARLIHTNPQAIKEAHCRFLSSGADVICTATYQASVEGFMKFLGLSSEQAVQLLMSGVYLAKEAALEFQQTCRDPERKKPLVAGSVGPYGAFLHDGSEYTGAYEETMSVQDFKAWHRQQIQCLVSAGVDLIAMETIPSQKEAEALVELLREFPNSKAWLSYSCKDEQCISHGEKFAEAVKVASRSEQLLAIGLNCCPPTLVSPLLASANKNKAPGLGWVVYPNGGGEWDQSTGWVMQKPKSSLADFSLEWEELGAKWIGGCCGITPSDIAELKHRLHDHSNSQEDPAV